MREILFRGKTLNCGWTYGLLFINSCGDSFITHNNNWQPTYSDPDSGNETEYDTIKIDTLGQYTGLKDKNATKIFEGDIIKWIDSDSNVRINKVTFTRGHFFIYNYNYTIDRYPDIEIIGNIHDNPELLNGDNDAKN